MVLLVIVKLQVLGLRLGVDFTFTLDNNDNNNNNDNDNDNNNPHLNFFKGIVIGVKKQGIRHKGKGSSVKGQGIRPNKWSLTLKTKSCLLCSLCFFYYH